MSTTDEQARAIVWAGGLLVEIARDESLPSALRDKAVKIARHFPTAGEVLLQSELVRQASPVLFSTCDASRRERLSWMDDRKDGPLTFDTRLD